MSSEMRRDTATEEFASMLRRGGSLAVVKPQSSIMPNAKLHSTIELGGASFDVLLFTSAQSGATVPFNVEDPKTVLLPVATVLEFLHGSINSACNLVHGNLNHDDVSVVDGNVVVSGFEHCGMHPVLPSEGRSLTSRPPGHLHSMAPELVFSGVRTTQTDIYAFGMLMYRMYAKKDPFDEIPSRYDVACTIQTVFGRRPSRIQHPYLTDELWALMNECWSQEPSSRPNMATVRARLANMV